VDAVENNKLVVSSVLSGNRNFEGRVHANVRANYLASPPLVVAYALAGTVKLNLTTDPLGTGSDGQPVYLRDIWPTQKEVNDLVHAVLTREMFQERYGDVFKGPEQWQAIRVDADSDTYRWNSGSTYVQNPPYFEGMTMDVGPITSVRGARVLAVLADSITTDHISPAGTSEELARRRVPGEHQVRQADFNSYGAAAATTRS
jgi:aconitate hydratase